MPVSGYVCDLPAFGLTDGCVLLQMKMRRAGTFTSSGKKAPMVASRNTSVVYMDDDDDDGKTQVRANARACAE